MGLDLRLPIGMMFSLLGALLVVYGLVTNGEDIYQASLGININLVWGGVLFVFGAIMFIFAVKDRRKKN